MAKLVVILGFAISFAAGLVVGARGDWSRLDAATPVAPDVATEPGPRGEGRPPGPPPPGPRGGPDRGPGGWLAAELGLTPEQHKKLDTIWSGFAQRGRRRDHEGRRKEMRDERDVAVAALIAPSRWGEYEQIMQDHADRSAELDREFRTEFDKAVERTKQILTPDQQARYAKLLERHRWEPRGGRPHRGDRERADRPGPETSPTSLPNR